MEHTYLLELGLEEMPARFITDLSKQLSERLENFLTDNRLTYQEVETYATPRRLAVSIKGLADKQTDLEELVRGPSLKIAKDENREWTKAAQGFAKGQGVEVSDLIVQDVNGQDYIFANKFQKGIEVKVILEEVPSILEAMTFPVSMTWSTNKHAFIRPLHSIVSLLDNEIVPFSFLGVEAGRTTKGHRFLGGKISLESALEYEDKLEENYVIADFSKRRNIIKEQIQALADENNWLVPMDSDLLNEVTALVEYPTAFYGEFSKEYLELPDIILQTTMRDHQRYFYVLDKDTKKMQAYFISVRNGDSNQIENVIRGNQKVIKARLEDALFFYQEDLKESISDYQIRLRNVNEHQKIGTYTEKEDRVVELVDKLSNILEVSESDNKIARQAAMVYKFDLVTLMVDEFSELQGEIGGIYAREFGIDDEIATAISQQYLPKHSGGDLPTTTPSSILAYCDKLDTLVNYFKAGLIPTGSQDPYALRRQAIGLVEITIANEWDFDLEELLKELVEEVDLYNSLVEFIKARLQQNLEKENISYDIITGVIKAPGLNILAKKNSALLLQELKDKDLEAYNSYLEAWTRVVNLGVKAEEVGSLDFNLVESTSEHELMQAVAMLPDTNLLDVIVDQLIAVVPLITEYFEDNMVNCEDLKVRANRYNTLNALTNYIFKLVDPRELIH